MASDLIKVCVFGKTDKDYLARIKSRDLGKVYARGFEIAAQADDNELGKMLAEVRPQVIVSFGKASAFRNLNEAPLCVRRLWVHYNDAATDPERVGEDIMQAFVVNAATERFPKLPLVSVITPTYKTGSKIHRPLESLLAQSYTNWEWVVYDDSPDDGATFAQMQRLAERDPRIQVFRGGKALGVIGEVKRRAFMLARGGILVELDHDDELTRDCLKYVVDAFAKFPEAGFAYTDCAETFDDGRAATYPEGWGFGFGTYRTEVCRGRTYAVTNYPSINAKTVRHIVGMPNHVRAWRASAYHAIGGHNPEVHVADDYEILVRTFLKTRMVHIRGFGYIQYYNSDTGNTQRQRNAEIQRLTAYFANHYNQQIHDRLVELGAQDFIWKNGRLDWSVPNPREARGRDVELVYEPYEAVAKAG
jgi:glycosyltransferase involved in cell wall biosynthesis